MEKFIIIDSKNSASRILMEASCHLTCHSNKTSVIMCWGFFLGKTRTAKNSHNQWPVDLSKHPRILWNQYHYASQILRNISSTKSLGKYSILLILLLRKFKDRPNVHLQDQRISSKNWARNSASLQLCTHFMERSICPSTFLEYVHASMRRNS